MQALAAVQSLSANDDERALLAPILCRERTPLLTVMIRNAFADIVMRLGPLVTDVNLGDENALAHDDMDEDSLLDMELHVALLTPRTFTAGRHATIRRALEQGVAFSALAMWSIAAAGTSGDSGRSLADRFNVVAADWHRTLTSLLSPGFSPSVTEPY